MEINKNSTNSSTMDRRNVLKGIAGMGVLAATDGIASAQKISSGSSVQAVQSIPQMKITRVDTIMTGRDVYVKITTDAGIVGYGDATNHFLPYSGKGMLDDISPYLIGEDPQKIEYLWQVCYRRRFMRGGPATGSAIAGIDQAL